MQPFILVSPHYKKQNLIIMQELLNQLIEKAGISPEQATKSLDVVKVFIKEKFPMLGGAVDSMIGSSPAPTEAAAAVATEAVAQPAAAVAEASGSMLDKISDVIPGQVGEKIEDFAKGIGDKISGLFGK